MKKVYINLNLKDIILRIQTHAYYTGKARKDSGTALRLAADMQISDSDTMQLNDHIETACAEVSKLISHYFGICNIKKSNNSEVPEMSIICYIISLPCNYPIELIEQVKQCIIHYIVMRCIQLWFMQCKPDETPLITNEVHIASTNLREIFTMRKHPRKELYKNKKHIDL